MPDLNPLGHDRRSIPHRGPGSEHTSTMRLLGPPCMMHGTAGPKVPARAVTELTAARHIDQPLGTLVRQPQHLIMRVSSFEPFRNLGRRPLEFQGTA